MRRSTLILALIGACGAVLLLLTLRRSDRNATLLERATLSIRAAEEVEVMLEAFIREHIMFLLTGTDEHRANRERHRVTLEGWIESGWAHVGTEEERRLLEEFERKARPFLAAPPGKDAVDFYEKARDDVIAMIRLTERFIELNVQQGDEVIETGRRARRFAGAVGIGIAVLLPLLVLAELALIRRFVYRPFAELGDSIARYDPGRSEVRAPDSGPAELRAIAIRFNEMADRLERQRESQLRFVAAVAHDLRNPLAALKASAFLAKRKGPVDPAQQEKHADRILRQVDRLQRMVEDLLDVSRVEAGHAQLRLETIDLREVAREAVELFEGTSEKHELRLALPDEPVPVRCDPARISQVLVNLLSNAIKYSPAGGPVDVELTAERGSALLGVRDRGIGIPPEARERIFEPFRRGPGAAGELPGVGLGLSVARKLVEAHGGRLEVESEPERGSLFRVRLPIEISSTH